jgi:excisionase family DNA binding protein
MAMNKSVLTTGDVAKICNVAPRTVSKWFDTGQLRGYRIPGSKDRRIPIDQLLRFMRAHGIPLNGLDTGQKRVLIVDEATELVSFLTLALQEDCGYDVRTAASAFEAGVLAESFKPHVIVVDVSLAGVDTRSLCRHIRSNPALENIRLIAMSGRMTEGTGQALMQEGFDGFIRKPFEIRELVQILEDARVAVH